MIIMMVASCDIQSDITELTRHSNKQWHVATCDLTAISQQLSHSVFRAVQSYAMDMYIYIIMCPCKLKDVQICCFIFTWWFRNLLYKAKFMMSEVLSLHT